MVFVTLMTYTNESLNSFIVVLIDAIKSELKD